MTEAAAIGAYLADAFPAAGLAPPPGDRRRAPYYRWMFFAAGPLEAVTNKALGFVVPEGRASTAGYGSLADVLNTAERVISERDYVAGDDFTAADVYFGSQIGWGMMFGAIDKRPAFEQCWARPAAARARAIDDALFAEKKKAGPAGWAFSVQGSCGDRGALSRWRASIPRRLVAGRVSIGAPKPQIRPIRKIIS